MQKAINGLFRSLPFFLIILFQFISAEGQNNISDSLNKERIQYIQNVLDEGRPNANGWWYGWLYGYTAATVGQGAVFFLSSEKSTRQDMALGAGTTFLGAMGQIIAPMVPGKAPQSLSLMEEDTPEERSQKLVKAEELLKASALKEKVGRSWQYQTICGIVNVSSGMITWIGFKRNVWAGVGNFALNTVITEAQIWTQPTRAMKDYQEYCRKYKDGAIPTAMKPEHKWYVNIYPGGIGVKLVF
jgi:hypothetical protein